MRRPVNIHTAYMTNHFKITLNHIRRSPYQAIAAVGICTLTLFMASIFATVAIGSSVILKYFETRPQVTAFFKDEVNETQIHEIRGRLNKSGLVSKVEYISKEDALALYKEQNKNDPALLEMVTASILPASLEISAYDPQALHQVAQIIKNEPLVEEVLFQEDIVSSLTTWTNSVRIIGVVLVSAFAFLTLIIILIIVGMRISTRKEEIEILYLVGADKWYIRSPFILEGVFYGFTGGLLSWLLTFLALLYSTPFLVDFLAGLPILPVPVSFYLFNLIGVLSSGVVLGLMASLLALKRYLK